MRRHKILNLTHWKWLNPTSSHFPLLWVSLWKSREGWQDLVGASWTALGVALFALFVLFVPFGRSTGLDFLAGHPLPHSIGFKPLLNTPSRAYSHLHTHTQGFDLYA